MSSIFVRPAIVLALMLGASALSVLAIPDARISDTRASFNLEESVPKEFADWKVDTTSVPLPPSPDQQSVLNAIYDQILSRTYVNSKGERIMLSITYGSRQNQQMRAHRQEVCYSAQGFKISGLERLPLTIAGGTIPSTRMVATQGPRVEPVTYWFTMGDQVVLTYFEREWAQLKFAMSGYIPDGYLVRISSLSTEGQIAFDKQIQFANELFPTLNPDLRRRLTGNS